MLELLIDNRKLKKVRAPKMDIGEFWTFEEVVNLFGIGQQAVHNSGSSMVDDTPSFARNVVDFLRNHINYDSEQFSDIIENLDDNFLKKQADSLIKFRSNKEYRIKVLDEIFNDPFKFKNNISIEYLYISIILYIVKKYNYFMSNKKEHKITKNSIEKYYNSETELLNEYHKKLINEVIINYLMDICYGRYYFLEVHFVEKNNIRNVPRRVVELFFETGIDKVLDKDYFEEELEDEVEQNKIQVLTGFSNDKMINLADNRKPELSSANGKKARYKTNTKLARTIVEKREFKCEYGSIISQDHPTFETKSGYYVEAHHLIPMSKQNDFIPINIDRSENIIVLCPNCHRAIHNGKDEEKIIRLEELFNEREDLLKAVGINITFDKLKEYYKINN